MRSLDRNVKKLSGKHIGSADAAADHGSAGTVNTGIWTLCTAKSEFHDTVSAGRMNDTCRLCGDQALMIDNI